MKAGCCGGVAVFVVSIPIQAQWLNQKTPGIPRTPDGKPDFSARAPRMANGKADFSGLWRTDNSGSAELGKATDAINTPPDRPDLRVPVEIVLDGDRLVMTGGGPREELIGLSATEFATARTAPVSNSSRMSTAHLIARIVEGDFKAVKK